MTEDEATVHVLRELTERGDAKRAARDRNAVGEAALGQFKTMLREAQGEAERGAEESRATARDQALHPDDAKAAAAWERASVTRARALDRVEMLASEIIPQAESDLEEARFWQDFRDEHHAHAEFDRQTMEEELPAVRRAIAAVLQFARDFTFQGRLSGWLYPHEALLRQLAEHLAKTVISIEKLGDPTAAYINGLKTLSPHEPTAEHAAWSRENARRPPALAAALPAEGVVITYSPAAPEIDQAPARAVPAPAPAAESTVLRIRSNQDTSPVTIKVGGE